MNREDLMEWEFQKSQLEQDHFNDTTNYYWDLSQSEPWNIEEIQGNNGIKREYW